MPAEARPCGLPRARSPELSVLIVNYRTPELVERCVESVLRDARGREVEILVADNASEDGSASRLRRSLLGCRLIENRENLGFGTAQNRLAELARARRLLILNPDTELRAGCLDALFTGLDENPAAGACGPTTRYTNGRLQDSVFAFPSLTRELLQLGLPGALLRRVPLVATWLRLRPCPRRTRFVDFVQGSCVMCRREAFREVGGFDEDFFLFSEEVDLQKRLSLRGWSVLFVAEAEIVHQQGKSMELAPVESYVQLYRAKRQYFDKHRSAWESRFVQRLWRVFHRSRAFAHGLLGRLGLDRSARKAALHRAALAELTEGGGSS